MLPDAHDVTVRMPEDIEVLEGDGKLVVETPTDRYVYLEQDDGNYLWDHDAVEVEEFPSAAVEDAVEAHSGREVLDHFPLTVTVYAHSDKNTTAMCRSAGLPTDDGNLIDSLWHYPGEFEITYEISEGGDRYDVTPIEIAYEGETFTPE